MRGRRQHLRAAVEGDHLEAPAAGGRARDQRERDVRPAGAHVQHGQLGPVGRERLDGALAQGHAAEPAVRAPEVAEVPGEGGRIVERAVQQLVDAGDALHRERLHRRRGWTEPATLGRDAAHPPPNAAARRGPGRGGARGRRRSGRRLHRAVPLAEPGRPWRGRASAPVPAVGGRHAGRGQRRVHGGDRDLGPRLPDRSRPDRRRDRRRHHLGAARGPAGVRQPRSRRARAPDRAARQAPVHGRRRRRLPLVHGHRRPRVPGARRAAGQRPRRCGRLALPDRPLPELRPSRGPASATTASGTGSRTGGRPRPSRPSRRRRGTRWRPDMAGSRSATPAASTAGSSPGHDTHRARARRRRAAPPQGQGAVPGRDQLPPGRLRPGGDPRRSSGRSARSRPAT